MLLPILCPLVVAVLLQEVARTAHAMPPEWNLPSMPASWVLNAGGAAHRCVRIPSSVELCSDIGYSEMRLPNMLNHDTAKEVEEQTKAWVPLAKQACHREIRVLLCSIYAPVCIQQLPDRQIKPCRSLCDAVMRPCAAVMENFGFSWPEILNCTQFPPDSDLMCIKSSMDLPTKSSAECHACPAKVTYESIIGNYCVNKVVLKVRIERVHLESGGLTQVQLKRRGLRFFKSSGLSRDQKRRLRTVVMETRGCTCAALNEAKTDSNKKFLLMGSVSEDGTVRVSQLVEWQQRSPAFKQALRQIRAGRKRGGGESAVCRVGAQLREPATTQAAPAPATAAPGTTERRTGGRGGGRGGRRGGNRGNGGGGGGGRGRGGGGGGGGGRKKKPKTPAPPVTDDVGGIGGPGASEFGGFNYRNRRNRRT